MQRCGFYTKEEKLVFVGHYWTEGDLDLESPNVCCVDYSVAIPRQQKPSPGFVAYRWSGSEPY
jgi:hypothetical protein